MTALYDPDLRQLLKFKALIGYFAVRILPLVVVWSLTALAVIHSAHAQVSASPSSVVETWTGTVTATGTGAGDMMGGRVIRHQSISATVTLTKSDTTGPSGGWHSDGPVNATADDQISSSRCANGGTPSVTWRGRGTAPGHVMLMIDFERRLLSLSLSTAIGVEVVSKSCDDRVTTNSQRYPVDATASPLLWTEPALSLAASRLQGNHKFADSQYPFVQWTITWDLARGIPDTIARKPSKDQKLKTTDEKLKATIDRRLKEVLRKHIDRQPTCAEARATLKSALQEYADTTSNLNILNRERRSLDLQKEAEIADWMGNLAEQVENPSAAQALAGSAARGLSFEALNQDTKAKSDEIALTQGQRARLLERLQDAQQSVERACGAGP